MIPPYICANFVYDLNGNKGPNTYGKDIGSIVALYPTDSQVVAPVLSKIGSTSSDYNESLLYCRTLDDSRLTTREESMALFVNKTLIGALGPMATTTTVIENEKSMVVHMDPACAMMGVINKTMKLRPVCVKR